MPQHGGNWLTALLPFVAIAIVLTLRLRSMSRERPLNADRLWIGPAIYVVVVASTLVALPPSESGWGVMIAGILVGAALGWHRGKLIRIERNPESGKLVQQASPLAMLLLVAVVLLKVGARTIFGSTASAHPGSGAMLLTDGFLGFAFGLISATRLELYLRARKILANG